MDAEFKKLKNYLKEHSPPSNIEKMKELLNLILMMLSNGRVRTPFEVRLKKSDDREISIVLANTAESSFYRKQYRFENLMPEKLLQEITGLNITRQNPVPESILYTVSDYEKLIKNNRDYNEKIFGSSFICFTESLFNTMQKLMRYAISDYPVLFYGEPGTFRAGLARALHHYREGGTLAEISCLNETPESLSTEIKLFLERDSGVRSGIIIKDIEHLVDNLEILEILVSEQPKNRFVYFTASDSFFEKGENIPDVIYHSLINFSIKTPPLRERHEDIFYIILDRVMDYNKSSTKKISAISNKFMQNAFKAWWPENFNELNRLLVKDLLNAKSDILDKFSEIEEAESRRTAALTPLEEGEKNVITEYLQKNKYNKNKTRKDLGISINTLNTKIDKYGIVAP